ncbi:MAG: TPM domain-containing protein, partial [Caulobacteraceae bacterium]
MTALTENDRVRIAEAVARAETQTSGEIVCILARQVSSYPEIPLAWAALIALAAPPLALALGADPVEIAGRFNQWSVGHGAAADDTALWMLGAYGLVQAALFAVTALIASLPPVRRLLTPP